MGIKAGAADASASGPYKTAPTATSEAADDGGGDSEGAAAKNDVYKDKESGWRGAAWTRRGGRRGGGEVDFRGGDGVGRSGAAPGRGARRRGAPAAVPAGCPVVWFLVRAAETAHYLVTLAHVRCVLFAQWQSLSSTSRRTLQGVSTSVTTKAAVGSRAAALSPRPLK